MRRVVGILLAVALWIGSEPAHAISFDLDTIASWGRFPRFCVNTYRWGDRFFNTYDSTYVVGTGTRFNVKGKFETWADFYNFNLPDRMRLRMVSEPSSTAGVWLSYMAVSVGYDKNVNRLFGYNPNGFQRFTFNFTCALFSADVYWVNNDVNTRIDRFGPRFNTVKQEFTFKGVDNEFWGIDLFYVFNNKRYSRAAAFNFSKLQLRSQGSMIAGLSYSYNHYNFDFNAIPDNIKEYMPAEWEGYRLTARNEDFMVLVGYAYNWVITPHLLFGISVAPTAGIRRGVVRSASQDELTFAMSGRARASLVWNSGPWFAGIISNGNFGMLYDRDYTFINSIVNGSVSAGYRFNLW